MEKDQKASTHTSAPAVPVNVWQPACSLWKREMVRFFRQRSRIIGALLTPIFFWVLLGTGLNRNFVLNQPEANTQQLEIADAATPIETSSHETGYLAYFFPGTVIMIVLFTAIFSMFSVIEDRREGFMQAVMVSPAPRLGIVLGKVMGCACIATIQGTLFLLAWPLIRGESMSMPLMQTIGHIIMAIGAMFLVGMSLAAFSLCLAWKINSTQGFHAVMNLILMPMWFLCGAVFPVPQEGVMKYVMYLNPLTYGHAFFTGTLTGNMTYTGLTGPIWMAPLAVLAGLGAAFLLASQVVTQQGKEAAA